MTSEKSLSTRIGNEARKRKISRQDAFTTYAMDRLLFRLGASSHGSQFALKGGVLVANLAGAQYRFTRDIDMLRIEVGPPDVDKMRAVFKEIAASNQGDGVIFHPKKVRAKKAERRTEDYDGVTVLISATIGSTPAEVKIDIGFGDAVVPSSFRRSLTPFLAEDEAARVVAYPVTVVIAEKAQTLIDKFPLIEHRLKDLLDIIMLSTQAQFSDEELIQSMSATLERRGTQPDLQTLHEFSVELCGVKWEREWAKMMKEKRVLDPPALSNAIERFTDLLIPVFNALNSR